MESIEDRIPIPPAVNSLLSVPSSNQSVLFARDPPTDSENEPRAATSLLVPPVKKLLGFVSRCRARRERRELHEIASVQRQLRHLLRLMTRPSEGFAVSTATSDATTSTDVLTDAGDKAKSKSRR